MTRRGRGCSNPGTAPTSRAAQLRAGLALEPAPRELIRDYLLQRVEHGTVRNRADVVAALQEAGLEVPRQGKDYLTALDPTTGDRWRLKGELYTHDFQRERLDRAVAGDGWRANARRSRNRPQASSSGSARTAGRVARNALHTIERDTAVATGRMRALLLKAWLRPLVVGLSLWLGICGGSWATMHWLSARIQARIETAAALDLDIEEARQTLARLETDTWGIALREIAGERFVVLPAGALAYPPRRVDTRPAVKLSNE